MHLKLSSAKIAAILSRGRWVNIDSSHDLVSDNTKHLPEPVLTSGTLWHSSVVSFNRNAEMSVKYENYTFKISLTFEGPVS